MATEQDRESIKARKPAVYKLRMLKEVTDKLKYVDLHESFLRHGLLKVGSQVHTTRSAPLYFKKLGGSVCSYRIPGSRLTPGRPADRF